MNLNDPLIINRKKSNHALILGCGESVNLIDEHFYEIIKDKVDIWGMNNFNYHPFIIPNFYSCYMEDDYNYIITNFLNKKKLYKNTVIFCGDDFTYNKVPDVFFKVRYEKDTTSERNKIVNFHNDHAIVNKKYSTIGISYLMSLSSVFDYDFIYILGVDLNNSKYFWYNWTGNFHRKFITWNKNQNDPYKIYRDTNKIVSFMEAYNRYYIIPNEKEMYICSKTSLLNSILTYCDLESLKNIKVPKTIRKNYLKYNNENN